MTAESATPSGRIRPAWPLLCSLFLSVACGPTDPGPGPGGADGGETQQDGGATGDGGTTPDGGSVDTTTDTDGDGLPDHEERTRWGTNPHVADTDGDGFSDSREINDLGFDAQSNNFLFNPRIADVPRLRLRLTSMPTYYVNYNSSISGSRSYSTSYADSSTTGTTRSWGGSQSRSIEMTHTAGVEMSVEHEFGITGGTSVGLSLSYEFSHSTTNETSTNWSDEQSQEHTQTLEESQSREEGETREFQGGILATTVEVANEGNVAFRLESLTLASYIHNPENPFALGPLENLRFHERDFPPVTLSPGATRGPLNFSAALDEPTILGLLEDSRNLVISPATYTLTGPNGEDLQLNETAISARTAHVVIDFGTQRPQEFYRVATIRDRDNPGLSVQELFAEVLRIPYTTGTFPWQFKDGAGESFAGLKSLRDHAASDADSSYWIVAHTYNTENGASVETRYYNPLLEAYAFEGLRLQKGDVLHLVYVQDADRDGLGDRSELVYGTDPQNPDTDGDGCGDSLEVGGWVIDDGGTAKRVYPSPLLVDTDGDTFSDCQEYNATPRTNPVDRPQNQVPVISSFTQTVEGMAVTVTAQFSDPDVNDRVQSLVITWGDGQSETVTVPQGTTQVVRSHTYATTGSYELTATAEDLNEALSATSRLQVQITMPTANLMAHFKFDEDVLDAHGSYDSGSYSFDRYAAGRSGAAGMALDPRVDNQTYGLFAGPHIPFSGSFTIAGWVKASSVNGSERIFGQGEWFTLKFSNSSTVTFSRVQGTNPDSATLVSASGHPANQWTFYAAVVSGDIGANQTTIKLYRDGAQQATRTISGVYTNPGSCRLFVGGFGDGNGCTDTDPPAQNEGGGLNGLVDDLRIYSRALTAAEVQILSSENRP